MHFKSKNENKPKKMNETNSSKIAAKKWNYLEITIKYFEIIIGKKGTNGTERKYLTSMSNAFLLMWKKF